MKINIKMIKKIQKEKMREIDEKREREREREKDVIRDVTSVLRR